MISKTAGLLMIKLIFLPLNRGNQIKIYGWECSHPRGSTEKALSVQSNISYKDVFMNIFSRHFLDIPSIYFCHI
jgi:hypothetical protein